MTGDSRVEAFRRAEQAYLSSFGVRAEARVVALNRLGIAGRFLEAGEGPPVLMLHGGGGVSSEWAPLMAQLDGFRLMAVDRPGFGLTDFIDYRTVDLKVHAIQYLDDIFDSTGVETVSIIANSMGALWSLWYAEAHPSRISRMVFLGTPALILDTSVPGPMRLLGVPGLNRLMMALEPPSPKQVHRMCERLGHNPEQVCTDELVELMLRKEQLPHYSAAWRTLVQNALPFGRVNPGLRFSVSALGRLSHEVLYIWGRRDPFGSLDAARCACEAMPNAELRIIGAGHLPWLDEPEACATVTSEFLQGAL